MEKENQISIQEEKHKKNKKLPKEVSQAILKKIVYNILKAIGIIIYFAILNLAYIRMNQERLIGEIQIYSGTFLVIGIVFLARTYKKESGEKAITAIEFIVLSLHSLSIMHVISMYEYDFRYYLLTSSYIFAIYYVLKAIIIYTKERRAYLKSLSDISEIVKKDEPIKKEAKKRKKQQEEDESKREEKSEVKVENKKEDKTKQKPKSKTKRVVKKTENKEKVEETENAKKSSKNKKAKPVKKVKDEKSKTKKKTKKEVSKDD